MSTKAPKVEGGVKKKNGFQKPLKITKELQDFLGTTKTMTRPELTKKFWAYFKENQLTDPADKRYVNSDEKLKSLTGEDRFLAFGFQKLISKHILKDEEGAGAAKAKPKSKGSKAKKAEEEDIEEDAEDAE